MAANGFDEKISLGGGSYLRVASDSPLDRVGFCRGAVLGGLLSECVVAKKLKAGWMRRAVRKIKKWRWFMSEIKSTRTVEICANLGNFSSIKLMSCVSKGHQEMSEEAERARALCEWTELGLDARRGLSAALTALGRPVSDDHYFVEAVKARVADRLASARLAKKEEVQNAE